MIIDSMRFRPYEYPFRSPFTTASHSLTNRKGFYVQLRSEDGVTGIGEASPLKGFTRETDEDVRGALSALEDLFSRSQQTFSFKDHLPMENDLLDSQLPTVRFALETALLDIRAQAMKVPVHSLLSAESLQTISVNATIGQMDKSRILEAAEQFVRDGFKTIKLKIGRKDFHADLEIIEAIVTESPEMVLRLDANQSWTYKEAAGYLRQLTDFPIEYIEQPVSADDLEALYQLKEENIIPIAADETANTIDSIKEITEKDAADYLIIKPAFQGITPAINAIVLAKQQDMKVVLTSGLDSIVGLSVVANLAAAFLPDVTHGLATESLLENDWPETIFSIQNGRLHLPDLPGIGISESIRSKVMSDV